MECHLEKITIHYETFGEGKPAIILHGKYLDHRHMVADLEPIFKHRINWKRLYLDLPGHGKTPSADWIVSNDHMLEVILDFIDNVIPDQRFLIVGCSYGGYLARGVVHNKSAFIDGLLVWISAITYGRRSLPPHVTLVEDPVLISHLNSDLEKESFAHFVVQSKRGVEYIKHFLVPALEITDKKFIETRTGNNFSFDVNGFDERLDKPTLIICGRQDSIVGYRDAWNILENYPRATFAVLDRTGHNIGSATGEQEELFKQLVKEWLDRVEENLN